MKKTTILSISMLAVLLVLSLLLVNSVSASMIVKEVTPNPGNVHQLITITITVGGEEATEWRPCELFVNFGDGTSQNVGKLVSEVPQFSKKIITHKYSKAGQFTIEIVPKNCKLSESSTLKTTVKILPLKLGTPPKKR